MSSIESVNGCWTRWAVEYGITAEQFGRIEDLEAEDVPDGGVHLLSGTRDFLDALPSPTLGFARAGGPPCAGPW